MVNFHCLFQPLLVLHSQREIPVQINRLGKHLKASQTGLFHPLRFTELFQCVKACPLFRVNVKLIILGKTVFNVILAEFPCNGASFFYTLHVHGPQSDDLRGSKCIRKNHGCVIRVEIHILYSQSVSQNKSLGQFFMFLGEILLHCIYAAHTPSCFLIRGDISSPSCTHNMSDTFGLCL